MKLESNFFPVQINEIEKVSIFRVKFDPKIPFENCKKMDQILKNNFNTMKVHISTYNQYIESPVISGMNIYSAGQCTSN